MSDEKLLINYKNRGMLLEKIINKTISYYSTNKVAFFIKNNLDIKFDKVIKSDKDNNILRLNTSFIKSKSTVDYYGIYKGQYITFEAKSTDENKLYFKNIKPHQHNHLKMIDEYGGKAFYIIMFKSLSRIFMIDVNNIDYDNESFISLNEVENKGQELEIIFPGIIDFLSFI